MNDQPERYLIDFAATGLLHSLNIFVWIESVKSGYTEYSTDILISLSFCLFILSRSMANPQIRCWFSQFYQIVSGGTEINGVVEEMKKLFLMTDEELQKLLSVLGSQIFFQSLDAAVLLFSRVTNIPAESLVLPVISTNDRLTLGCELWDGTIIHGQEQILNLLDLFNLLISKATICRLQAWVQVFLLKGSHDQETSGPSASGFINAVQKL
ncbi:hypothetical protein C5167_016713 [Papaver somniferum]|nr:hypothetical protein C5167_016713 [Papaver somniferum]